jgi:riboflavin kinase/FMN adenylyltransferase
VGHRALITCTRNEGERRGIPAAVVTWDRHPAETLRPDRVPPLLCTPERKVKLLEETGVDVLSVLAFDKELSTWPPQRFVDRVLVTGLRARSVIVGAGWRFGHRAVGDAELLRTLGSARGFDVTEVAGGPASSSRVRAAVGAGDLELAARLLGRPFEVQGKVVHGHHRGKALGYPTANLVPVPGLLYPPRGVYAGEAHLGGQRRQAAINVGVNPTFANAGENPLRVEAYLLDFDGDLYGQVLRVAFHRRLREERTFSSVEDLVDQMGRDVEETRALTC